MDEPRDGPKKIDRRKLLAGAGIAVAAVFAGAFVNHAPKLVENIVNKITGKKNLIRIGFEGVVYAIAPDITVDGTDDHIQVQQALDALPAKGGKIIAYGGDYDFGAIVSRAINNVVFEGSGKATYFANNASDNLITAGVQTGWIIKDLRTDAGGLGGTWGSAAGNLRKSVWVNTTYYNDLGITDIVELDTTPTLGGDLNRNDKLIYQAFTDAGTITDATKTFNLSSSDHKAVVDPAGGTLAINLTDPGQAGVLSYLVLTKSADADEQLLTFHADTNLDHAANWANEDKPTTMGTTSGARMLIWILRLSAASKYLAGYTTMGVDT